VKRILLLLALLPSLASAASPTNSGAWTTAGIWDTGAVPGATTSVTNSNAAITVTDVRACKSLLWLAGTLTHGAQTFSIPTSIFLSNCVFSSTAADSRYISTTNLTIDASATISNATFMLLSSGDISALANKAGVTRLWIFGSGTTTLDAVTNSSLKLFLGGNTTTTLFSKTNTIALLSSGTTGQNVYFDNTIVTVGSAVSPNSISLSPTIVSMTNSTLQVVGATTRGVHLGGGLYNLTNSTMLFYGSLAGEKVITNCTFTTDASSTVVLGGDSVASLNSAGTTFGSLVITNSPSLTYPVRLASGLSASTLTVAAGELQSYGYTQTATTMLLSGGTLAASNSTITVSNFVNSATFTHSGVTRMLAGGVFNSTNGATLSVISGNVTLATNTVLSGTIYSEAPGASLNLNQGTLTVSGQSLFGGVVSNGTIGTGAPVTAERTQGVSGRINSIEQMGAE
jgi:hypothetical protein